MALLATQVLTLADHAARLNGAGKIDTIVEMLEKTNEILDDMLIREANNGDAHKTTVRTGIPQAAWRLLNYGVPRGKSTTAQVSDGCGMLETYSEVDKDLANMNGNTNEFRASEATAFVEGMNQQMASTIFYGNVVANPERFLGLSPRYNTLDTAKAASAYNVIDAGGTGSTNTSAWLIVWGEQTCHGIFPKGSNAGLQHQDLGEQTLFDANNNQYQGYRDHWQWKMGLTLRDWRYVVRIANIDTTLALSNADYLKSLIRVFIIAEERIINMSQGKPAWYVNRQLRTLLRLARLEKIAGNLTEETLNGKRVTQFDGIPVRMSEALLNTEARVTA